MSNTTREERDQLFLELREQGNTLWDISRETGSAEGTISKALRRQGVVTSKRRPDSKKPGPLPTDTMIEALCNECGNIRKARANHMERYSRKLRCDVCGRATEHFGVNTDHASDWRESSNAEVNKQARLAVQLQESVAMLDRLDIRFDLVESDEWYAKIWRERGRGSEVCSSSSRPI